MDHSDDFKIFWDAVHGQIKISNFFCKHILDTEHFQRLKRLEQTNARPLYPCAHHDRFVHSLGTYHLGSLVLKSIKKNSKSFIRNYAKNKRITNPISWETLTYEFSLACLLHDVGHAPFSHTFEQFFNVDLKAPKNNHVLDDYLLNKNGSHQIPNISEKFSSDFRAFSKDYELAIKGNNFSCNGKEFKIGSNPKEHEKVSAFLVLTKFQDVIRNSFGSNPFNIARMILGIKFSEGFDCEANLIEKEIYNCFIELLNGEEIDVDKIDYLIRDQWATGNEFRRIDYVRLLTSVYIREDKDSQLLSIFFHKKAINEIMAIKETKNTIAVNIHSHPVVKYDDHILKKAVNEVVKLDINEFLKSTEEDSSLCKHEGKENYISNLISIDALMSSVSFSNSRIYLPSDDDLVHLLKKHISNSVYAQEWLSRDYILKALWKSPFDFNFYFKELNSHEKKVLFMRIEKITELYLSSCSSLNLKIRHEPYFIQKKRLQEHKFFEFKSNLNIILDVEKMTTEKLSKLLIAKNDLSPEQDPNKKNVDTNTYFILYLPSPFDNKIINDKKQKERLAFYSFAIKNVKKYLNYLTEGIVNVLRSNHGLMLAQISSHLYKDKEQFEISDNKQEFEETIGFLVLRLLDLKKIACDKDFIHPRKRKYFEINTAQSTSE